MRKFAVLLLLSLLACQRPTPPIKPVPNEPKPPQQKSQGEWRATLGTSGGITGGGQSTEIWSDGSVFSISILGANAGPGTTYLGQWDQARIDTLYGSLKKAKSVNHSDYQNMTTTLAWLGQDPVFRHDWAWGFEDSSIPSVLKELESKFADREGLQQPQPGMQWNGKPLTEGRAELFLAQGQTYTLTLQVGTQTFKASGKGQLGSLSGLVGLTLSLEESGSVEVEKVEGGWLTGHLTRAEQKTPFRLPAWLTVAP